MKPIWKHLAGKAARALEEDFIDCAGQAAGLNKGNQPQSAKKNPNKELCPLLGFVMERVMGVEPTYQPWEGRILPMNYTRAMSIL